MLRSKAPKFAILAAVCLLATGASRSASAQAYTVTNLSAPPGNNDNASFAYGINSAGQVVGDSVVV